MADEWYEGASFKRTSTFRFGDCDPDKNATLYAIMPMPTPPPRIACGRKAPTRMS